MLRLSYLLVLTLLATTACNFAACHDRDEKDDCDDEDYDKDDFKKPTGPGDNSTKLVCRSPTPFLCRNSKLGPMKFCCNDRKLKLDDCSRKTYWKYFGFAVGGVALLALLGGLTFGLVMLVKVVCCKHRSAVVRSSVATPSAAGADYPKHLGVEPDWQEPPKKPPQYFDVFMVTPPPDYKERPESA